MATATQVKTEGKGVVLQETTYGTHAYKVDREKNVVRNCKVLGRVSANGREYSPNAMNNVVRLLESNGKVNIDHIEAGKRRPLGARNGSLSNPHVESDGVYADWNYNPKHSLTEQLLWDAENNPKNFGFSIDAKGTVVRRGTKRLVESVEVLKSSDLVGDPATTNGLFESEDPETETELEEGESPMTLKELSLDQLRRERPDLIESVLTDLEESTESKKREQELKDLKAKIELLESEKAQLALKDVVLTELKEAKLDPTDEVAVSAPFMSSLLSAKDKAAREVLIKDRQTLLEGRKPEPAKPGPTSGSRWNAKGQNSGTQSAGATPKERINRWAM